MITTYRRLVPWEKAMMCNECQRELVATGQGRTRLVTEWEHECACGRSWMAARYPLTIFLPEGVSPEAQ